MDHLGHEHTDPELDSLLRRVRPEPEESWVRTLEHRLLPRAPKRAAVWRVPHVRLGAAIAGGLAALLVTLGLAGVGPFGGDPADVRAKQDCNLVQVTRVERVPRLVEGADGRSRIVYQPERVRRTERRCR